MSTKAETLLTRTIIEAITRSRRACVWRQQSGVVAVRRGWMHLAPEGSSDIVGYMLDGSGRHVAIEVKGASAHGRRGASDEQQSALEAARSAGCVVGVATSVDEALAIVA